LEEIKALTGEPVEQVVELKTQFDPQEPFVPQVNALIGQVGFTPQQWQTTRLLVNPPSLNVIAATVLPSSTGEWGTSRPSSG
jgi:hypothetical protein